MNNAKEIPGDFGLGGTGTSTELRPPAAAIIRRTLALAGVLGIRIIGHPGAGKTDLIGATLRHLPSPRRVAAIVVNPAAARDAEKLQQYCSHVAHVEAASPVASSISKVIAQMKLSELDMVLIEAAGGLAPLQDLGQDATVAVFAVSGGDDKAAEYHGLLKAASAVVVTKCDLCPYVHFDWDVVRRDVRSINPTAEIFEVSSETGSGIDAWAAWLGRMRLSKRRRPETSKDPSPEAYFG
jgi:hydrogenase nickel incorporation protein HypB